MNRRSFLKLAGLMPVAAGAAMLPNVFATSTGFQGNFPNYSPPPIPSGTEMLTTNELLASKIPIQRQTGGYDTALFRVLFSIEIPPCTSTPMLLVGQFEATNDYGEAVMMVAYIVKAASKDGVEGDIVWKRPTGTNITPSQHHYDQPVFAPVVTTGGIYNLVVYAASSATSTKELSIEDGGAFTALLFK